jgi:NAD(P)H-flavin reductase
MHAVWVFWEGASRDLAGWYVNIQEPFRRTSIGFDTQDLELDIVIEPDGSWR